MTFSQTPLAGAWVIDLKRHEDARGFFAESWSESDFQRQGLPTRVAQTNVSWNRRRATLRGLHRQLPPHDGTKLVRCTRGSIWDVIVDLRPESSTYRRWYGVELSAQNYRMVYVPEGFAHGYQTLADDTEVTYQVSCGWAPGAEWGARYDDPAFAIEWPLPVEVLSDRDRAWPPFNACTALND